MDLNEARERIRAVDEEMAALFVKRMEAVEAVAAYKRERGLPIEDLAQEARVIEGRSGLIGDEALRDCYVQFLQGTMDVSKRWQRRLMEGLRVAYCGVEGAFAHIAAKRIFPEGTHVPFSSFEAAYKAVEGGFAITDVGCVPVYCWKRDDNIQAISSLKYLDAPPEGMSGGTWQRMKDSYWELRNLIDESIPMLAE